MVTLTKEVKERVVFRILRAAQAKKSAHHLRHQYAKAMREVVDSEPHLNPVHLASRHKT